MWLSGTPETVQAALRALVFTPRENQVSPGQTVTTDFTLSVTDGTATATDDTTTVVATSVNDSPTALVDADPRANRVVEGAGSGAASSGENLAPLAGPFVPDTAASAAARLYYELLRHPSEATGLAAWTGRLRAGASLTSVAEGFLVSAEYAVHAPGPGDAAYVEQLCVGGLGRVTDPGGHAAQLARLAAGTSRAELAADFVGRDLASPRRARQGTKGATVLPLLRRPEARRSPT